MHGLEAPLLSRQLSGEPVEQGGMRGRLALRAEILWRGERSAKVLLPQAVGRETQGRGIFRMGEPSGEFGACAFGGSVLGGVDDFRKSGFYRIAGAAEIAADHHAGGGELAGAQGANGEVAGFDFLELQVALEERAHLVKLALADRIEFVIVTLCTAQRNAE